MWRNTVFISKSYSLSGYVTFLSENIPFSPIAVYMLKSYKTLHLESICFTLCICSWKKQNVNWKKRFKNICSNSGQQPLTQPSKSLEYVLWKILGRLFIQEIFLQRIFLQACCKPGQTQTKQSVPNSLSKIEKSSPVKTRKNVFKVPKNTLKYLKVLRSFQKYQKVPKIPKITNNY